MRLRFIWALLALETLASLGCEHKVLAPTRPQTVVHAVPSPIDLFIQSEHVAKPQPWHGFVPLNGGEVMFFRLRYGDIHYDFAGDWYSEAWGLKYGSRVGWVFHEGSYGNPTLTMFDPSAGDTYLFSEDTWIALQSDDLPYLDRWMFDAGFLPMVAQDPDTPEATLFVILDRYLSSYIAQVLLRNSAVQRNRAILTRLVSIALSPPLAGDASWSYVASRALELLGALPPSQRAASIR